MRLGSLGGTSALGSNMYPCERVIDFKTTAPQVIATSGCARAGSNLTAASLSQSSSWPTNDPANGKIVRRFANRHLRERMTFFLREWTGTSADTTPKTKPIVANLLVFLIVEEPDSAGGVQYEYQGEIQVSAGASAVVVSGDNRVVPDNSLICDTMTVVDDQFESGRKIIGSVAGGRAAFDFDTAGACGMVILVKSGTNAATAAGVLFREY